MTQPDAWSMLQRRAKPGRLQNARRERTIAAEFTSYAVVQEDASLRIRNQVVRLFGIYIPQNSQFCNVNPQPPFCGARAAAALDFKIKGFVTCQETGTIYSDGSISAVCWTNRGSFNAGEDLGAYLISARPALTGPDAPFEYQALERIAQTTNQGVWGFQADNFASRSSRYGFR